MSVSFLLCRNPTTETQWYLHEWLRRRIHWNWKLTVQKVWRISNFRATFLYFAVWCERFFPKELWRCNWHIYKQILNWIFLTRESSVEQCTFFYTAAVNDLSSVSPTKFFERNLTGRRSNCNYYGNLMRIMKLIRPVVIIHGRILL